MAFQVIDQLPIEKGDKVFLRLDLNVPLEGGRITDDTRIKAALPTLHHLIEKGAKIVVCSHLGRPKGEADAKYSLAPVGHELSTRLDKEVVFIENYTSEPLENVLNQIDANQIVLLENLRFHEGEKSNDEAFARKIGGACDFYCNDAFGTVHRAHASTFGVAELFPIEKRAAGFLIQKEVDALQSVRKNPKGPFTVIMGGAKVSDKIEVILSLLQKCNHLIIGGAMAYTLLKFKGVAVGKSRVEEDKMDLVEMIFRNAEERKVKIHLPVDHRCAAEFSETAKMELLEDASIPDGLMGLDIGPKTEDTFSRIISDSKTVLWNGPMGVFEWDQYANGSLAIAKALAASNALTIVGGGDSVAALNKSGLGDKVSHVSTGGGASLELLEGKTLPGLQVLSK